MHLLVVHEKMCSSSALPQARLDGSTISDVGNEVIPRTADQQVRKGDTMHKPARSGGHEFQHPILALLMKDASRHRLLDDVFVPCLCTRTRRNLELKNRGVSRHPHPSLMPLTRLIPNSSTLPRMRLEQLCVVGVSCSCLATVPCSRNWSCCHGRAHQSPALLR